MHNWREELRSAFPDDGNLHDGSSLEFAFTLRSIELYGGDSIAVQEAGVTALVGANNAGKSTILREVWEKLRKEQGHQEPRTRSVETLKLDVRGGPADAIAWVGENASFVQRDTTVGFQRALTGIVHPRFLAAGIHTKPNSSLGQLASFLVLYGNAQGRFGIGGSAEMRQNADDPPEHPVHRLQDTKELLDEASAISEKIFGEPLTLDLLGRTIRLRVGDVGMPAPPIDAVPPEYRERMVRLQPLDEQGDGMRSLMGQLLPVMTSSYGLLLIDEPEAFLHPPQAHALGVELGRVAKREGLQLVLATHDRSLLSGLLESGVHVSVVRLTRESGPPSARQLGSDQLQALWVDPVLKYTNVLDGLFHRLVVVAEAERDCAYLAAALDCETRSSDMIPHNEVLFVPTGGKDGMAKVCSALSAVGVPVVAAPDFDMISDKAHLKALVESVEGTWSEEMENLWKIATADLLGVQEPAKNGHVLDAIAGILSPIREDTYSRETKAAINAQLRTGKSPWESVKTHGLSAFKGEARAAAATLLERLEDAGVVLVEQGELESLAPEVARRKGAGWLQEALKLNAQCNSTTQAHVQRILTVGMRKKHASSTNDDK